MNDLAAALTFQAGYNAALVAIGATILGGAAGAAGTFLFLRKRALVSDAIAHATLPGIGIAFIFMVLLGGDGRNLPGLLLGSAVTASIGFWVVEWLAARRKLSEDTAIGAVLSVFFGIGVVLLTVIQNMSIGRQAGLESFLLGSTAGMLFADAIMIAVASLLVAAAIYILRRQMTLVAFDEGYAKAQGVNVRRIDLWIMGIVMAVTVIGLKIVGLVLIVALLIIPAVTARFWSDRVDRMLLIATGIGAFSGYFGSALSASASGLPTGPIIVLVAAALFTLSLLLSPERGLLSSVWRHHGFQKRVHRRQGLLALARQEPILDTLTLSVLTKDGLIRSDGVATEAGKAQAARALRDEKRWEVAREVYRDTALPGRYDGLTRVEDVLTADEIASLDARIGTPQGVA